MESAKYPTGETVWVQYHDEDGNLKFIITSKPLRDQYFLYELQNEKFVCIGKAENPTEMEVEFQLKEKLQKKNPTQKRAKTSQTNKS